MVGVFAEIERSIIQERVRAPALRAPQGAFSANIAKVSD
jgi:hypothetical protein